MAAKPHRPLSVTTDRVLEWFKRSPFAQELERDARAAEALHDARVQAYDRWHEAERRKAEIPVLEKAVRDAETEYRSVVVPAAAKIAKARTALDRLRQEISAAQRRAELVLRDTAHDDVRDSADVWYTLVRAREHVASHTTVEAPQLRVTLKDMRRMGFPEGHAETADLERQIAEIDAVEAVLPAFNAAAEQLREVQLEVAPDLPKIIDAVLDPLPATCPVCHERLNLHGQIAEIFRRPRWTDLDARTAPKTEG